MLWEIWFGKSLALKYHLMSFDIRDIENKKQTSNKRWCPKTKWQKRKIDLKTKTVVITFAEAFITKFLRYI